MSQGLPSRRAMVQTQALVDGAILAAMMRSNGVRAANVRLVEFAQRDERLDAHLNAILVTGASALVTLVEEHRGGSGAASFALAAIAFEGSTSDFGALSLQLLEACQSDRSAVAVPATVAALSRISSHRAISIGADLLRADAATHRMIAVAVCGNRRTAMEDERLSRLVADPSSRVRARAYRTAGQLGRADLMAHLRPGLTDDDPECRFWSAWAVARMGGGDEALRVLADIAWNNLPRADRALDLLLRRLDLPQANAWLREFAKIPGRQRTVIRATGAIGDPLYIPWLIERMGTLETARLAGEAFSMITGLDLAYRDLDRRPPADFQSGPNDDPADENVALDEDEYLPWPDSEKIGQWWVANRGRFDAGTPYFLGTPKPAADWLEALSDAFQRQRHAAALELAIRQPDKAMFEVRARGRLQRQLIARARGLV